MWASAGLGRPPGSRSGPVGTALTLLSAIHLSWTFTSCVVYQRSSGSFARHFLTRQRSPCGGIGCSVVIGAGSELRIAAIRVACCPWNDGQSTTCVSDDAVNLRRRTPPRLASGDAPPRSILPRHVLPDACRVAVSRIPPSRTVTRSTLHAAASPRFGNGARGAATP